MLKLIIIILTIFIAGCVSQPDNNELWDNSIISGVAKSHDRFAFCSSCPKPTPKYIAEPAQAKLVVTTRERVNSFVPQKTHWTVFFELDSASISKDSLNVLRSIKVPSNYDIQITGYTDAHGSQAYNNKLALRRALSSSLIIQKFYPKHKILKTGKGKCCFYPSSPFDKKNRRVEISINKGVFK